MNLLSAIVRFDLGGVIVTPEADERLMPSDILEALDRHRRGDWGQLDEVEWKLNDQACEFGGRLESRFRSKRGLMFYVATDVLRILTIIRLPGQTLT
jgi:hypothetical protein